MQIDITYGMVFFLYDRVNDGYVYWTFIKGGIGLKLDKIFDQGL